jgi:hypothetical protein
MTESDINNLIDNGVVENISLEYKRELNIIRESDKIEFLSDVSSFANAIGGQIIYGISEDRKNGKPEKALGVAIENIDQEILKIESILKNGLEPRIVNLKIEYIKLKDIKYIIIINILRSWISPHRVIFNNHGHFYIRTSNSKHKMDVSELKVAFNLAESATDRIKTFRHNRISSIISGETPFSFIDNPSKVLFHLVPLNSLSIGTIYDINPSRYNSLIPLYCEGWNTNFNFDGYIAYSKNKEGKSYSYVQLFKNGIIESLEGIYFSDDGDGKWFYPNTLERELLLGLKNYLKVQQSIGVSMPIIIFLTFINCKGFSIKGDRFSFRDIIKIDKDILYFPEILIESFDELPHIFFRSTLDCIWNACGYSSCPNYDDNGNWINK